MAFENPIDLVAASPLVPAGLVALLLKRGEPLLDVIELRVGEIEVLAERLCERIALNTVEGEVLGRPSSSMRVTALTTWS